ncbi:peptide chain release factor N(5)-glutamine methyltransferase [Idiomarina seosinensis]|uniref:Release factor glutamine methyltransferase n=1 Tax=Idiomarina seosinensis TaxID=281739 RepID=A0A432ZH79_9GAMM|nr:peptide chain release factor N(5)-glutamine methyltransferase [Idiomarina seosinensis]RUO77244.1 peptide chain release factor N(5)-glutamine methyltransferase [Idiomarina seosinensis]
MKLPSIDQALLWCQQKLSTSESPAVDSRALLCYVLSKPRSYLMTWPDKLLSDQQWQQFQWLAEQRTQGKPVAHLTGQREFWSLPLTVNDSTLIPRPDTETLVAAALSLELPADAKVLDLGTGTGAIALALKSEKPQWQMVAVDRQQAAVDLAAHNSAQLQLPIETRKSYWFDSIKDLSGFDLIVSNPPYIDANDSHLEEGDVRFEPRSALVAANKGLADIEWIIERAADHLVANGWLLLEQGWQQADSVVELLRDNGYKNINRWADYGSVDRVTGGQKAS